MDQKQSSLQLEPSPSGRLYLDPPLTPVPSRPGSPLLAPQSAGKPRSQHSTDDENDTEIHDLFQKSHTVSDSSEQARESSAPSEPPSPHPPRCFSWCAPYLESGHSL